MLFIQGLRGAALAEDEKSLRRQACIQKKDRLTLEKI